MKNKASAIADRNKLLGKALQEKFSANTKEISSANNTFTESVDKIAEALNNAKISETEFIKDLEKALTNLDKGSKSYKDEKAALELRVKEAKSKMEAFSSLEMSLGSNYKITEVLMDKLSKGIDVKDLIGHQINTLNEISLLMRGLNVDPQFDIKDTLEKFSSILDKKQIEKIEKNNKRLTDFLLNPMQKAGFFATAIRMFSAQALGPIGVQVVEALDLVRRSETYTDKILRKVLGLEEKASKQEDIYKELEKRIKDSELSDEKKDLLLRRLNERGEQKEELEADKTADYRAASLALMKKNHKESGSFLAAILNFLAGNKLVRLIGSVVTTALSALGIKKLVEKLLGKKLTTVPTDLGTGEKTKRTKRSPRSKPGASSKPSIPPATIAKTGGKVGMRAIPYAGWLYTGYEGLDYLVNDLYEDEVRDAIWWALQEAPTEVKERYAKAKENAATDILTAAANAQTTFWQKFSSISTYHAATANFFRGTKNKPNPAKYEGLIDLVSKVKTNSPVYNVPQVEMFRTKPTTTPTSNQTNAPQSSAPVPQAPSNQFNGLISLDEIPMTPEDKTLAILAAKLA